MATLLGAHCPSLSARLCLIAGSRSLSLPSRLCQGAASCLHSQVSRQMMKLETQSVMPYMITSLTPKHSYSNLHLGRTMSNPSLGRTVCVRMLHSVGCMQNGSPVLVMRYGDKMMYVRCISSSEGPKRMSKTDALLYMLSMLTMFLALAYVGVPLFKLFCRQFGFGGKPELSLGHDRSKVATMKKVEDRELTVIFNADRHAAMKWNFQPQQTFMKLKIGETALAFYRAENPSDKPIIGIATYTVTPFIAAPYFNKIQCFCFEEQILNPHEQVDMPVFFYIDPEYDEDPMLEFEDRITLSYTFFEAKEGMELPLPGFMKPSQKNPSQQTT